MDILTFLVNYAYFPVSKDKKGAKEDLKINVLKGTAYIPLIGVITQIFHYREVKKLADGPSQKDMQARAWGKARIFLALVPGVLPILDIIGSIWLQVELAKRKNKP